MNNEEFNILKGEWAGLGEMVVGSHVGKIVESMIIEETDIKNCFSYIRKSSIDFGQRVTLHNELGYIKPVSTNLMLSRGSYIIMKWDEGTGGYVQYEGSPDSKNMVRKIVFDGNSSMTWDNIMDVDHGGNWVKHTADTTFTRIA